MGTKVQMATGEEIHCREKERHPRPDSTKGRRDRTGTGVGGTRCSAPGCFLKPQKGRRRCHVLGSKSNIVGSR